MGTRGIRCAKFVVALVVALGVLPAAFADVVELKNGDRITGTVSMTDSGTLRVSTEYAGDLDIPLEHVQSVRTETPVAIEDAEGVIQEGVLLVEDGTQQLERGGEVEAVDLEAIQRIQPDAESMESVIAEEEKIWSGTIGAGTVFRSGETDTFDASIDVAFERTKPSNVLGLNFNAAYGETEENLDTQRIFGEVKWQFYPRDRFYYFVVGSGEHDKPRQLELRAKGGGGVGYDFIKNDRRSLSADAGLEYVYERWKNFGPGGYRAARNDARQAALNDILAFGGAPATPPGVIELARDAITFWDPDLPPETRTDNYISGRLGARYKQSIFKHSELSDTLNVLPNLEDFGAFLLTNKFAFTTPFSESLSLRLQLRTEYDSEPEANVDEFDNTLSIDVIWRY